MHTIYPNICAYFCSCWEWVYNTSSTALQCRVLMGCGVAQSAHATRITAQRVILNVVIKPPFLQMELDIVNPSSTQSVLLLLLLKTRCRVGRAWAQAWLPSATCPRYSHTYLVFLCFAWFIPSSTVCLESAFNILKSKDWQITFKYEACAKPIWMFNKVILFPQAQNNKQLYHVEMCSNFIWQLRLWFGYVVAFIGNPASWIWLRTERS